MARRKSHTHIKWRRQRLGTEKRQEFLRLEFPKTKQPKSKKK